MLLNEPIDISPDFADPENTVFIPEQLVGFDPATRRGQLRWRRERPGAIMLFNSMDRHNQLVEANEWPRDVYPENPVLPFELQFVSASTLRIRMSSQAAAHTAGMSPMLAREPADSGAWSGTQVDEGYEFRSSSGSLLVRSNPWQLELRDSQGRHLTSTMTDRRLMSFSFVRRAADYSRSISAVFTLSPDEKILGGGEAFSRLDKRGQKLVLSTTDAFGVESPRMHKPVPFFLSSRGYGLFIHSSTPITCDIGATRYDRTALILGDDELDLFLFLGSPKEIIDAYTDLVGKAPLPPLWSFGLWMSRITYSSQQEVYDVATKIRASRVPCDVVHLDTGWFEQEWECDYAFSTSRFSDPRQMIADLKADNFNVSLWQLPYFIPRNRLFPEITQQGLAVRDAKGKVPTEDAILDFSNPATVAWYQGHIARLLEMGISAIKADFGEAAPINGLYASGSTGFYEHNLYPVRYQQALAESTRRLTGEQVIWARAGWAGCQRYPVHWGGDPGRTPSAMAATLRGGLSLGVCGFSFWSHDIAGFGGKASPELYRNWAPFGLLSSHSRVHGEPPTEPWQFGEEILDGFRRAAELRYRLMPYIYAQARDCSQRGLPMLRALCIEFPDDPGAWQVDDAYLFGSALLVAPLFELNATERDVYLPAGTWIDYQSGRSYSGGWRRIQAGPIPAIILVRDGTAIPHIGLAQSTKTMDWSRLELVVFATEACSEAHGQLCLPADQQLHALSLVKGDTGFNLAADPVADMVTWAIRHAPGAQA